MELHCHTHYSALDGLNTPEEYLVRAKEMGMTHLAITDHETLAGHREFQRAAKDVGVTPILGIESYITDDRFDRRSKASRTDGTSVYSHIILLAKNENGLKNLNKLNERAFTEGFYFKPRIDFELLAEYSDDLILTSACMGGLLSKALLNEDPERAENYAKKLSEVAPGRFYIELQGHNPPDLNHGLIALADKLDLPLVATSDCHYARKEDLWVEEAMLILSTNPKPLPRSLLDMDKARKMDFLERYNYMYPDRKMTFEKIEIFLHSAQEHRDAFAQQGIDREDLYQNTVKIAQSIGEYPYHQKLDLLPQPKGIDPAVALRQKYREGMTRRGLSNIQKYESRGKMELAAIEDKGFSAYILIVADAVQWAKRHGIMVGPGRGSGAGSLVNYALGITDIDPLEYGLVFERFIDPERSDYPDIDLDLQYNRRDEVKDYVRRKYGHVASIATFTMFKDKNVIKDAARVLRIPISDVNRATKNVDAPPGHDFFDVFKDSRQGQEFNDKYPDVMKLAAALRGRIRSTGMHAAGIVLSKMDLAELAPIQTAKNPADDKGPRVQFLAVDMEGAEDIGLIKFDFLGLKTLSVVSDTLDLIEARHGKNIDMYALGLDDQNVYRMLSSGQTRGVFQCEATPSTKLLMRMNINSFKDLVVSNALVRPGAMNVFGEAYLKRRAGKQKAKSIHPSVDKFLTDTYFLPIYQEQSMRLVSDLAGLGMSMANKVRKITAKKKDVALLTEYKEKFVAGATPKVGREVAEFLWSSIEETASYSFNLSHAVAYSTISYWTAWLKYYYPKEFMVSLLNNESSNDSVTDYLIEAKRLGMKIKLPHVNYSGVNFTVEGDDIRMGLSNIKYISEIRASKLVEYAPYRDYKELSAWVNTTGNGLNKQVLAGLDAIGAAQFEDNPLHGSERSNLYEYLGIPEFDIGSVPDIIRTQLSPLHAENDENCFDEQGVYLIRAMVRKIKQGDGWARADVLDNTGSRGIFLGEDTELESDNIYIMLVANNRVAEACADDAVTEDKDDIFVKYLWELYYPELEDNEYKVVSFRPRKTRAGDDMAYMIVADRDKQLTMVLVFKSIFNKASLLCKPGSTVKLKLERMRDGGVTIAEIK